MKLAIISSFVALASAVTQHPVIHHDTGYGFTPAPPTPYGYTPVPLHHSPAPYHDPYAPAPYHDPYAPAPYSAHPPLHHPAPESHHEAPPPKCSENNPKTWCIEDPEHPTHEINKAIEYHYDSVQQIYKDVLANTDNSVDRLKEIVQETYLCPSESAYIQPLRAVNTEGKWRIIVNHVKAHYNMLTQTVRIEECTTAGEACPLIPACYETKCLQKSVYHRFLVYDPYDHYLPFAIESFKLPSACACYNDIYTKPPHY